jgi:TetR/AcrR family transcriptional repressor of nem operon
VSGRGRPGPLRSAAAARILDVAERLVPRRGFDGLSYADVAAELGGDPGEPPLPLPEHFPSKAALGEALVARYTERFAAERETIGARAGGAAAKLAAYAELYARVLRSERMGLRGRLAAGYETLPEARRGAVLRFFDLNQRWLGGVLEEGRTSSALRVAAPAPEAAQTLLSALEGARLVARSYRDPARFEAAAARILAGFAGAPAPAGSPASTGGAPRDAAGQPRASAQSTCRHPRARAASSR